MQLPPTEGCLLLWSIGLSALETCRLANAAVQAVLRTRGGPAFVNIYRREPFREYVVRMRDANENLPDMMRIANRMAAALAAMPHRMGCPGEGG